MRCPDWLQNSIVSGAARHVAAPGAGKYALKKHKQAAKTVAQRQRVEMTVREFSFLEQSFHTGQFKDVLIPGTLG